MGRQYLVEPHLHRVPGPPCRHRCAGQPLLRPEARASGRSAFPRRWVIYKNLAEASQVPPEWHGWMHYMVDTPPTEEAYVARPWQKQHVMNMTGTPAPTGRRAASSPAASGRRPPATIRHGGRARAPSPAADTAGASVTLAPRFSPQVGIASASTICGSHGRTLHDQCGQSSVGQGAHAGARCVGVSSGRAGARPACRELHGSLCRARQGDGRRPEGHGQAQRHRPFRTLRITPRACYTRPPTEPPRTTTFVEIDEIMFDGKEKRIFSGWMFAESPGLNPLVHPVFDVWLTSCSEPQGGAPAAKGPQAGTGSGPPAAAEPPRRRRAPR